MLALSLCASFDMTYIVVDNANNYSTFGEVTDLIIYNGKPGWLIRLYVYKYKNHFMK